jgi:hypothetical protein
MNAASVERVALDLDSNCSADCSLLLLCPNVCSHVRSSALYSTTPESAAVCVCACQCASLVYVFGCDVWLRVAVFISACVARMLYPIKLYIYTYEWLGGIDPLLLSK